mgnify:CR=1 FL=1
MLFRSANALTNTSINSAAWTFNSGNSVLINNTVAAGITSIIGYGADATPTTDAVGKIKDVIMITQGNAYIVPPYVTIKTANSSANVATSAISLTAQNYLATVTVANNTLSGTSTPTGSGYAFGVSEGVVYQKGYFLYVNPQKIVKKQTKKFAERENTILSIQTFKRWKRVDDLVAAVPYIDGKVIVGGDGEHAGGGGC